MSTNIQDAARELQYALQKCDELQSAINSLLRVDRADLVSVLAHEDIDYAMGKVSKALKKNNQTRHNLIKAGKTVAPHKAKLEATILGDGDDDGDTPTDAPIVCGC